MLNSLASQISMWRGIPNEDVLGKMLVDTLLERSGKIDGACGLPA